MKILVFSWRGPGHPLSGGAEQVMHEHMKGWIGAGHKVLLFTSHFKGAMKREVVDGVEILRMGSQYLTCHFLAVIWYLLGNHSRFDLVVDQFHGWPFFTPFYVRSPKIAVIQELTREVWFRYHLPLGLNYILGTFGYLLEPLFFMAYKNITFMTGSDSTKKELTTFGIDASHIEVVPHGIVLDLQEVLLPKEKTATITFLGALASDKGIEDAIKAFGILNKKDNYQFWVVGHGETYYLRHLKHLASQLGLGKKIVFWGFVSGKKKFELLSASHLLVNPSVREGWGLVNIEANAVGTPVVAYKSPGLVDSVREGISGVFVDQNSPENLARKVELLIKNRNRLTRFSESAIAWSKNFSWEKSRKLSLKLIERIAK